MSDRVLIVMDDQFELSSIGAALKLHGVNIVGEARKQSIAVSMFRSMQPNVLVIDMHLSDETSLAIAATIRSESPSIGVVLLMPCADMRLIGEQNSKIPSGSSIVLKNSLSNITALCDVISSSRIQGSLNPVRWVNGGVSSPEIESGALMSKLSDIQIETIRHVANGLTNAEIGRVRFVSEKAVEQIIARVAMTLNIQPDHRRNMRVLLVKEYLKWIGAPRY